MRGVFDTVNYLARQTLPFRGHRDSGGIFSDQQGNDGNFRNLIRLLASRDELFQKALLTSPKNATYLSSTVQNEVIASMHKIALEKFLMKLKESEFFTILADESGDSGKEQMSIAIRFIDNEEGKITKAFIMLLDRVLNDEVRTSLTQLFEFYAVDMNGSIQMFYAEVEMWQKRLKNMVEKPKSALDHLKSCPKDLFPNVFTLLKICNVIPVTTADVERSFSKMKQLKTEDRNATGEERLNGLMFLSIHRNIEV